MVRSTLLVCFSAGLLSATTWLTDLAHLPPPVAGSMPTWAQVIAGAIPEPLTREMVALAAELPLHQLLREATLPPPAVFRIQELAADPGGLGLSYASASPRLERFRIQSAALNVQFSSVFIQRSLGNVKRKGGRGPLPSPYY